MTLEDMHFQLALEAGARRSNLRSRRSAARLLGGYFDLRSRTIFISIGRGTRSSMTCRTATGGERAAPAATTTFWSTASSPIGETCRPAPRRADSRESASDRQPDSCCGRMSAARMTASSTDAIRDRSFSAEVIADPQPDYKELRDKYPVYYSEEYDTYFFSRFDDVWEVLRVGDNALAGDRKQSPDAGVSAQAPEQCRRAALRLHQSHGAGPRLPSPWYEEMRLAHTAPLRPKSVAALKDFVSDLARERLDAASAAPQVRSHAWTMPA